MVYSKQSCSASSGFSLNFMNSDLWQHQSFEPESIEACPQKPVRAWPPLLLVILLSCRERGSAGAETVWVEAGVTL